MYTREEAIRECVVLWEWLAENSKPEHGHRGNKESAIKVLFEAGSLWRGRYYNNCPLCEYVSSGGYVGCDHCPWPGVGGVRCCSDGGAYERWEDYASGPRAVKVLELVKTLK